MSAAVLNPAHRLVSQVITASLLSSFYMEWIIGCAGGTETEIGRFSIITSYFTKQMKIFPG